MYQKLASNLLFYTRDFQSLNYDAMETPSYLWATIFTSHLSLQTPPSTLLHPSREAPHSVKTSAL